MTVVQKHTKGAATKAEAAVKRAVDRNTKQHGKAAAVALLHELERINGHYDAAERLEAQESVKLLASYLDAFRNAPAEARVANAIQREDASPT